MIKLVIHNLNRKYQLLTINIFQMKFNVKFRFKIERSTGLNQFQKVRQLTFLNDVTDHSNHDKCVLFTYIYICIVTYCENLC